MAPSFAPESRTRAAWTIRSPPRSTTSFSWTCRLPSSLPQRKDLVVVGNGMVGNRLLDFLIERGLERQWRIRVLCEEPRLAYDRVNLSKLFQGTTAAELELADPDRYGRAGIELFVGEAAGSIDRATRTVRSAAGRAFAYDK